LTPTRRHDDTTTRRHDDTTTRRHDDTTTRRHDDTTTRRHDDIIGDDVDAPKRRGRSAGKQRAGPGPCRWVPKVRRRRHA
jgi:hypothetical protein